ncbi:MAG: hypothetical protein WC856_13770 [Methylococcaceae bacterium]|jgi:hypothetical protein
MADWDYGGAHKKYDMEGVIHLPAESRVQVCDWLIEMPEFMKEADTLFIDCPWNIGNVNTFYTKADKEYPQVGFAVFTAKLFLRIGEIDPEFLFIEIGKEYLAEYLLECKSRFKYVTFYNSTYYKKAENKCYIIHATNTHKHRRYKELEDIDEEKVISWLCKNHDFNCIGDLCMGTGLVGKYAYMYGKKFVGTELNKKRLALLVDFIKGKKL